MILGVSFLTLLFEPESFNTKNYTKLYINVGVSFTNKKNPSKRRVFLCSGCWILTRDLRIMIPNNIFLGWESIYRILPSSSTRYEPNTLCLQYWFRMVLDDLIRIMNNICNVTKMWRLIVHLNTFHFTLAHIQLLNRKALFISINRAF